MPHHPCKGDLVNEEQKADLETKISLLNPHAKILKSIQCKINVLDILNTGLYKDKEEFYVTSTKTAEYAEQERQRLEKLGKRVPDACTARFDIKSFVYRARKPFHPGRLRDLFMEPYFMDPTVALEEDDAEDEDRTEEVKKKMEEEKQIELKKIQDEAHTKQRKRTELMGELLRSKGFFWLANSHVSIEATEAYKCSKFEFVPCAGYSGRLAAGGQRAAGGGGAALDVSGDRALGGRGQRGPYQGQHEETQRGGGYCHVFRSTYV